MFRRCLAALRPLVRRPRRALAVAGLLALILIGGGAGGAQLWAAYHYRAARQALDRYHFDEARPHLQACLLVWPRSAAAHLLAARAARQADSFDEAGRELDACERLRGRTEEDLLLERALLRAQRGDVNAVKKFCHHHIEENDPASPLIFEALAQGYIRTYRLAEADVCLGMWLDRQPDNPQALLLRGWSREIRAAYEVAVQDYRRAVEIDPDRDQARFRLATCLLETTEVDEAAGHLEYLLRRKPEDPELLVRLARCRLQQARLGEAEALLDGVLAARPRDAMALNERGKLALQTGDAEGAVTWLRRAVEAAPPEYQSHYSLHQALEQAGRADEARDELARLKVLQADTARMRQIINQELGFRPHDPGLQCEVGTIMLRDGVTKEGLHWLQGALKEDPRYAPAHAALADYYEKAGDPERAAYHRRLTQERSAAPAAEPPSS